MLVYHWNSLNFHCQTSVAWGRCHIWELRCLGAGTCPAPGQKINHQRTEFSSTSNFIRFGNGLIGWFVYWKWFSSSTPQTSHNSRMVTGVHLKCGSIFMGCCLAGLKSIQNSGQSCQCVGSGVNSTSDIDCIPPLFTIFSAPCAVRFRPLSAAEEFVGQSRHLSLATASLWRQLLRQVAREFGVQQHWDGLLAAQLDGFWCGYLDFTGCFWNRSQGYKWVPKFVLHGIKFFEELQFSAWF